MRAELEAQARAAGLGGSVRFTGAVPHEDLPAWYSAADVCVVPSYYESFGLVAVEAMACGTPVVASRVGGLVSTVTDGVNGYLIPWRCPEPFAEKLEVLIRNPELRANFAQLRPGVRRALPLGRDCAPHGRRSTRMSSPTTRKPEVVGI